MFLTLLGFSIYISLVDLKQHRISNRSLLTGTIAFALFALLEERTLYWSSSLLTLAFAPVAFKAKIGAGDIKLTSLLALFFLPLEHSILVDALICFVVISSAFLIFNIAKENSLKSSIALAPAICGAVIWCAR